MESDDEIGPHAYAALLVQAGASPCLTPGPQYLKQGRGLETPASTAPGHAPLLQRHRGDQAPRASSETAAAANKPIEWGVAAGRTGDARSRFAPPTSAVFELLARRSEDRAIGAGGDGSKGVKKKCGLVDRVSNRRRGGTSSHTLAAELGARPKCPAPRRVHAEPAKCEKNERRWAKRCVYLRGVVQ
ncbi:hypothetical protein HPB50_002648 [Hyalomma asiaticum]|uniref:Uncharacterized protein n=1 Tax=Hyalomma asiaticum TaxID=266040 RepID=A0ACB7T054_HYAAI|nr:hypothetical protein HPB50_002648 [Hyalomma asiaticum]